MAGTLENISPVTVGARAALSAVYRTAQMIAPLPNRSYQNKAKARIINFTMILALYSSLYSPVLKSHRFTFFLLGIP